ncbi:3-oxoacid CoA-transferase subunit B [Kyrpidia spormannii]|uniref:Acetoacetyl CoA-transferase (Subunit B) n=2 Tax=Kyrpidia spormannii TaxID=2055160 RepID=A0ACA8Z718_9BACL|nr:3-oxoacid CoA-transferase subunit B [Kyrpidia spormannii]CAB3390658.1 acetoacetyl CoA-transferase (subunit B) [Kyrpidia spormannii]CAB3391574.1 acetoacetyl CoA-transferase (subunit B) [Kyrpidia spormannii]HHY66557.1 3-oxoacid CoA-transferase subunit B [Alicyclobacillus sp.]
MTDPRQAIAARAARELGDGDVVNLGIGIPTLVVDYLPPGVKVHVHTENGLLGVGPTPNPGEVDPDVINAGKLPVTAIRGSSFFSSADSFAMIRGGHIDVAVLGALQVDQHGRVANWTVPGQTVLGVGGAMDLLTGAKRVIVTMTHMTRDGRPKIVEECTLPLTSSRSVDVVVTELAVFRVVDGRLVLTELAQGLDLETVRRKTAAPFAVDLGLRRDR